MCHFCLALSWLIFSPGDKRDGPFHCCEISAQKRTRSARKCKLFITPAVSSNDASFFGAEFLKCFAQAELSWNLSFFANCEFDSCHVILTGRRMLKLASNFEMFNHFFVFCWIEKREELLYNFYNEITQLILDLEDAPRCISQQH